MLSIRLPAKIEQRLDALARETGKTKTSYIREAILACLEDFEDVHLAEQRLSEFRARQSKTFTLDEVERELGLTS